MSDTEKEQEEPKELMLPQLYEKLHFTLAKVAGFEQIQRTLLGGLSGVVPPFRGWISIPDYLNDAAALKDIKENLDVKLADMHKNSHTPTVDNIINKSDLPAKYVTVSIQEAREIEQRVFYHQQCNLQVVSWWVQTAEKLKEYEEYNKKLQADLNTSQIAAAASDQALKQLIVVVTKLQAELDRIQTTSSPICNAAPSKYIAVIAVDDVKRLLTAAGNIPEKPSPVHHLMTPGFEELKNALHELKAKCNL